MSEMTIEEAFNKMALRWGMPKKSEYMELFLDVIPNSDNDIVVEAFKFFAYQADKRPYPGAFSVKFWELKHRKTREEQEDGPGEGEEKGCSRCSCGKVFFVKMQKIHTGEFVRRMDFGLCANCHHEPAGERFFLQIQDKIYLADKQIGKNLWVPAPNNRNLMFALAVRHKSALLEESYELGMIPCPEDMVEQIQNINLRESLRLLSRATNANFKKKPQDVPF